MKHLSQFCYTRKKIMRVTSRMLICPIFVLCTTLCYRWSRWILIFFMVFFLCYSLKHIRTIMGKKETTIVLVAAILLVTIYYRMPDSIQHEVQNVPSQRIKSPSVPDSWKLSLDEVWNGRKLKKSEGEDNKKKTGGQNSQNGNLNSTKWESTSGNRKLDNTGNDSNNNATRIGEKRDKMEDIFFKTEKTCKGNKTITCSCPDFTPYQSQAGNINHTEYP